MRHIMNLLVIYDQVRLEVRTFSFSFFFFIVLRLCVRFPQFEYLCLFINLFIIFFYLLLFLIYSKLFFCNFKSSTSLFSIFNFVYFLSDISSFQFFPISILFLFVFLFFFVRFYTSCFIFHFSFFIFHFSFFIFHFSFFIFPFLFSF